MFCCFNNIVQYQNFMFWKNSFCQHEDVLKFPQYLVKDVFVYGRCSYNNYLVYNQL